MVYVISPPGAETERVSPGFLPRSDLPKGLSVESFCSLGLLS